jgi:cell division protein FtsL
MIRLVHLFWVGVVALAAALVFNVSHEVQELKQERAALAEKIRHEQETIRVLEAEWAFLNQPARLEAMARRHTSLRATAPDQIIRLESIPEKIAIAEAPKMPGTARAAAPRKP